jgi:hypothetical protein
MTDWTNNPRTGWNPDAVAPPMRGGVYERDRPHGTLRGHIYAVMVGAGLAMLCVTIELIGRLPTN